MRENPLKKNSRFYLGMVLNVAEGMLSGFNFLLLYEAMKMLWNGTINSPSLLRLSLFFRRHFHSAYCDLQRWLYTKSDRWCSGQQPYPAIPGR